MKIIMSEWIQQLELLVYSKIKTIEAEICTLLLKEHVKDVHWWITHLKGDIAVQRKRAAVTGLATHQGLCYCQKDILTEGSEVQDN